MIKPDNPKSAYHGIIISLSQRDRSIFRELTVIGKNKLLLGLLTFYKVSANPDELDAVIGRLQANMTSRVLWKSQEFYAHFYRGDELVIVFRDRTFKVTTDASTWSEAIRYGRSLGIKEAQLDFTPCRFEDESF
jgi:hypothetical protein